MTSIIVSLLIGLAAGLFINYAITFRRGQGRNIGACVIGALLGGAVLPWLLSITSLLAAIIGSLVGIAVALWVVWKVTENE